MKAPPPDPIRLSRAAMRSSLPKRFYREVDVAGCDGVFVVRLDGREARTPGARALALPTRAAAEAVAAEWAGQGAHIDPAAMPLTRLANSALDTVAADPEAVAAEIVRFAGSDLLCYRAGEPDRLVELQAAAWDPVLAWADEVLGARFLLSQGIVFVGQPEATLAAIGRAVAAIPRPFGLAALSLMTTLAGSALLALAVVRGRLGADEAWAAAHVDEDFEIAAWGEDVEAAARRAGRRTDFMAAGEFAQAVGA